MSTIITVLDSINPTTMPYNEFVLYRNSHYLDEKQILLKTGNNFTIPKDQIPDNIEIYQVGKNPFKIRRALNRIFKENKDVIIHLHSIKGAFATLIAMIGDKHRKHTVYTIHSTFSGYKFYNKVFCFFDALLSNYTTCVSKTSYEALPGILKKIKGNHITFIENGVDIGRVDRTIDSIISNRKNKNNQMFCVYIARTAPMKNHKFLIDVLIECNENIQFLFIGEANNEIREYAKKQGVADRIEFTGLIPREEVYMRVINADLYISSSLFEGLPVSVLEALYCGLPAVLSDIPQHREIVEGIDGAELIGLDKSRWINTLERWLRMPEDERERLGEVCHKHVIEKFSLKSMHENYDKVYNLVNG